MSESLLSGLVEDILKIMCVELINGAKKNGKYVAYDLILEK